MSGTIPPTLEIRYFVNYQRHEEFLGELNTYIGQNRYTATAPRPRWDLPSHFGIVGIIEASAKEASLLYRAEAELLFYDLLNINNQRTNQSLLRDPDLIYRLRGKLWKQVEPQPVEDSGDIDQIAINPPALSSKEFKEVANSLAKMPKEH